MESWLHTLSLSQAPAAARNEMSKPTFHPYTASADERIPEIFSAYSEICVLSTKFEQNGHRELSSVRTSGAHAF